MNLFQKVMKMIGLDIKPVKRWNVAPGLNNRSSKYSPHYGKQAAARNLKRLEAGTLQHF